MLHSSSSRLRCYTVHHHGYDVTQFIITVMMLHSSSSQLRCYTVHHHSYDVTQFIITVKMLRSSSSRFLIFLLIIFYTVFLNFALSSVSHNIKCVFIEYQLCVICPKYLNLLIVAKVSTECLGIIWLVTDTFILLAVHGIINLSFICFPLHQSRTAGKTVGYSWCWLILLSLLWLLSNVPLLVCLSLYFSCSLHWCSCHWWW